MVLKNNNTRHIKLGNKYLTCKALTQKITIWGGAGL